MEIERLVLVYDADGGLFGEIAYLIGKVRGTSHCALCDITHGATGERRAWRECRASLRVPIAQLHRNELDGPQHRACEGVLPCVLAKIADGYVTLVEPEALDACGGSVEALRAAIHAGARARGLTLNER